MDLTAHGKRIPAEKLCPNYLKRLARPTGFEPVTPAFGGQYSIQLSYGRTIEEHFSPSPVSPRLALLVKCSILPIRDTHYLRKSDFSFSNQKPNNETNGCPEPLFEPGACLSTARSKLVLRSQLSTYFLQSAPISRHCPGNRCHLRAFPDAHQGIVSVEHCLGSAVPC